MFEHMQPEQNENHSSSTKRNNCLKLETKRIERIRWRDKKNHLFFSERKTKIDCARENGSSYKSSKSPMNTNVWKK